MRSGWVVTNTPACLFVKMRGGDHEREVWLCNCCEAQGSARGRRCRQCVCLDVCAEVAMASDGVRRRRAERLFLTGNEEFRDKTRN